MTDRKLLDGGMDEATKSYGEPLNVFTAALIALRVVEEIAERTLANDRMVCLEDETMEDFKSRRGWEQQSLGIDAGEAATKLVEAMK